MKSLLSHHGRETSIEVLEARIAPATIFTTGVPNNLGNDTDFNTSGGPFVNTGTGTDQISMAVGGDADTYYLKMSTGDVLKIFNTTNGAQEYLTVRSGNIVAFFVDKDGDKEVEEGELVSMSLGKSAAVFLRAGLEGDIVTNLDEKSTKDKSDDSLDMSELEGVPKTSGLVSGKQAIKELSIVGGGVGGKILSGGNLQNVSVNGTVDSILAGTSATGATFDFFPRRVGGEGIVSFSAADIKSGASISKIFVDGIGTGGVGKIAAGGGGIGSSGGSIKSVQIVADRDGFTLQSGAGGSGPKGGSGGSISEIFIAGTADAFPNSQIKFISGVGGAADSGAGGRGGNVSEVFVGFQVVGGKPFETTLPVLENVSIEAGVGGAGKKGGAGGAVFEINIRVATPDAVGDEITIIAGMGGAKNVGTGGKSGVGGSLKSIDVESQTSTAASVILQAGNAGTSAVGDSKGANGGSITGATVVSTVQSIFAGNGSSGKVGGRGGSLKDIILPEFPEVTPSRAIFNAGIGGNGDAGRGGAGGSITDVLVQNGDFSALRFNTDNAANGGSSVSNKGGAGGSVSRLDLLDLALRFDEGAVLGDLLVRTGVGGSGAKAGGSGGDFTSSRFIGIDVTADVRAGSGGNVVAGGSGKGGNGGSIQGVNMALAGNTLGPAPQPGDPQPLIPVSASVFTGAGGLGAGNGAGGTGGDARSISVNVSGSAFLTAGAGGGAAAGGKVGNGGSILVSGVFGDTGSGALIAGDAGATGGKAGNGGSISGTSSQNLVGIYASEELTVRAGNGSQGGSGGSVRFLGYGSTSETLTPSPNGNILIRAGDGSASSRAAGSGGSIDNVSGSASSTSDRTTTIRAGDGGGQGSKSASGGSVEDLVISRGGIKFGIVATNSILTVEAGNAGDGSTAIGGANGGSVRNVSVDDIGGVKFQRVAAGDGGDAVRKGGNGGSVNEVRVTGTLNPFGTVLLPGDIGIRTGAVYGYTSMGGIFAGLGGSGVVDGRAGSVTNIGADSIAAIVAGRGEAPGQVQNVDFIGLNSQQLLQAKLGAFVSAFNADGSPTYRFDPEYYIDANFVGAVANINRDQTWVFQFNDEDADGVYDLGEVPIDGLIVAKNINQKNFNFTPEARYADQVDGKPAVNDEGNSQPFYDFNNRI